MTQQANKNTQLSHLQAYKVSALSKKDYCRINNISYYQLTHWLKNLQKISAKLVPVRIAQPQDVTETVLCSLQLRKDLCLKIHDLKALTTILASIKQSCF